MKPDPTKTTSPLLLAIYEAGRRARNVPGLHDAAAASVRDTRERMASLYATFDMLDADRVANGEEPRQTPGGRAAAARADEADSFVLRAWRGDIATTAELEVLTAGRDAGAIFRMLDSAARHLFDGLDAGGRAALRDCFKGVEVCDLRGSVEEAAAWLLESFDMEEEHERDMAAL